MLVLRRKCKKLESGDLVGIYLTWYGMVRIFTETLRSKSGANEILMLGPIPVSIALSVIFIICGIAFLVAKRFIGPRNKYLDILKEVEENRFDTVIFDLDGTLLDSKNLIFRSFIHTFAHFRPDTPVTHVITPSGIFTSTFFRLFWAAPLIFIHLPSSFLVSSGISIFIRPDK